MAYRDFKYLTRRKVSDKTLLHKAFNIAKNIKFDGYQRGLALMVYKFFDKKSYCGATTLANKSGVKNEIIQDKESAEEWHKLIIRKFYKPKVYSPFTGNIWSADLAGMQLISKFNKETRFLLCAINVFSKYTWVIPLKDKKGVPIIHAFQKISDETNCKPNKMWIDKGSEFYNRSMKSWLQDNNIEIYSIHNEGKSVVAERFIKINL